MFTIQYEGTDGKHHLQEFSERSRLRLTLYLANYDYPIVAVYEQASPITKTVQSLLRTYPGSIGKHARDFAFMSQA